MPRPPPPQLALRMPGKPTSRIRPSAASGSAGSTPVAGTVGTPAASAMARADTLSPRRRRVSGRGADEGDPGCCAGLRKLRRLGEEAVAGVDGVGSGPGRDPHDLVHREIGGDRPQTLPDPVGLVGLGAMQGEAILVGEHRDRGLPHLVGRAQHPDRDLAAIRHQDFREPVHRSRPSPPTGTRATIHAPKAPFEAPSRPSVGGSASSLPRIFHAGRCTGVRGARASVHMRQTMKPSGPTRIR